MATLIIGANGSMGTRYKAILKHLQIETWGVDINDPKDEIMAKASDADRIILCTPTDNHFEYLKSLLPLKKPLLCEKPISKSLSELDSIFSMVERYETPLSMTFQYSELVPTTPRYGKSYYKYFRSGADGLYWDCLQIIALARGEIEISNDSPLWQCMINDTKLDLSQMDFAYLNFVRKWTQDRIKQSPEHLMKIHEKVEKFKNARNQ